MNTTKINVLFDVDGVILADALVGAFHLSLVLQGLRLKNLYLHIFVGG